MTKNKKLLITVILGVLIIALFGLIMAHELGNGDFPPHIAWAKQYAETGYLNKIPHTLFAKLVVIIRALLPANILVLISPLAKQVFDLKSFEISAWLLMILSYLATVYILIKRLMREWKQKNGEKPLIVAAVASLIVLLVGPIFLFTYPERMYLGYYSPNPYHNPTYVLFRPFVLLAFFSIVDNLYAKWDWKKAISIAFLIMCATLAKPSFTITILPALGIVMVLHIKDWKKFNWLYVIIPLGLTSLIVLGAQYYVNYSGYWGDQVVVAPFQVLLTYVPNIALVFVFGFLSILFPLLVSIFHWKENSNKVSFQLVWLNFLIAILLNYIFGEKFNLGSNNFGWGAMIAVFLLFVENVIIFGRTLYAKGIKKSIKSWKFDLVGSVLILHLICGIIYYLSCLMSQVPLVN